MQMKEIRLSPCGLSVLQECVCFRASWSDDILLTNSQLMQEGTSGDPQSCVSV